MKTSSQKAIHRALNQLKATQQYRQLHPFESVKTQIIVQGRTLLNISSNDYLGVQSTAQYWEDFLSQINALPACQRPSMGATSSRLLTGNHSELQHLETELQAWYQQGYLRQWRTKIAVQANQVANEFFDHNHISNVKHAVCPEPDVLVVNSGYHANIGVLPALASLPLPTVIIADKRVHASLIDGLKLSQNKYCTYRRYRHNDYEHLQAIIATLPADIERIIVVTESVFSMDGDCADLTALVALKMGDTRIELYVDEAHAVGVIGEHGLGLAEQTQTLMHIDYLIGTFGKAFASMGAYIVCTTATKQWLVNQMRPLIYSTALPPMTHCWTRFILAKMSSSDFNLRRDHLRKLSYQVAIAVQQHQYQSTQHQSTQHQSTQYQSIQYPNTSSKQTQSSPSPIYQTAIIPFVVGSNTNAVTKSNQLEHAGFYAPPIRPPTVPSGSARLRLVMTASLTLTDCQRLVEAL